MHSFQPSRGRVLFEFVCALGIVASCVGAWKQTGASSLLLAAFVAGLYGFVRLMDLGRPRAASPAPQQEAEPAPVPERQADIRTFLEAVGPEPMVAEVPEPVEPAYEAPRLEVYEAHRIEPAPEEASRPSQAKPRRKSGGRKPKSADEAKVVELAPPEEAAVVEPAPPEEVVEFALPDESEVADLAAPEEAEVAEFPAPEEAAHPHIAPLFEPEPFARMPRRAFGRRGRI